MRAAVPYVRLLIDDPLPGPRNMAVDEALMRSARALSDEGTGTTNRPTLRFYRWEPGCLSFGRNQVARGAYEPDAAAARGIDVVRRPTGGRTVFHHRELTYSVTAPSDAWGSLRETYCRINRALAAGLTELGAPVACAGEAAPGARAPGPAARACFRDPLPGEVVARGRKLIGSAQWRDGGALLQHGSLLLVDEQAMAEELRTTAVPPVAGAGSGSPSAASATGAIALGELLPTLPPLDALVAALVVGFERELGLPVRPGRLSPAESAAVDELEVRYVDPAWTWRR